MIRTMAGAALLVLALPVLATAQEPTPEVEAGRALFQGRGSCFTCHGREGGGTPLGPDLTDEAWVNFEQRPTREQVETLITNGVPRPVEHPAPMPPMGGAQLSEEEVSQLAAYVLYLGVKETEKGGGPR